MVYCMEGVIISIGIFAYFVYLSYWSYKQSCIDF